MLPEPGPPAESKRTHLLSWEEPSTANVDTAGPESAVKVRIQSRLQGRCWGPAPHLGGTCVFAHRESAVSSAAAWSKRLPLPPAPSHHSAHLGPDLGHF